MRIVCYTSIMINRNSLPTHHFLQNPALVRLLNPSQFAFFRNILHLP